MAIAFKFALILVLVGLFSDVGAILCYQCQNEGCHNGSMEVVSCRPEEDACMKLTTSTGRFERNGDSHSVTMFGLESRLCANAESVRNGQLNSCYYSTAGGGGDTEICLCPTNKCNGAQPLRLALPPTLLLLAILAAFWAF